MLAKHLLPALVALLLSPSLTAQETIFLSGSGTDPYQVEVQALFSLASKGGFMPVRISVKNQMKEAGRYSLRFNSQSYGFGRERGSVRSDYEFSAEPEKTTTQEILVPLFNPSTGSSGGRLDVKMTGDFGNVEGAVEAMGSDSQPLVLLSEPLYTPSASGLDAEASGRPGGGGSYGRRNFCGKFDPRSMPGDWRAYSGYDAVGMRDADWNTVSASARNALLQWVRMGGRLVIYSQERTALMSLGIKTDGAGLEGSRSLGKVEIQPLPPALILEPVKTVDFYFGTKSGAPIPSFHGNINGSFSSVMWPLQVLLGSKAFNYTVFVVVLIAFAILVGPINLFVFAKSGRRHRLFLTTPLIALGASAVLVVMIFIQDGFGGQGVRQVWMEVRPDNGENMAYVHQEQFSRTGVLLGSGFDVKGISAITPVRLDSSRWTRFTNNYSTASRFDFQSSDDGWKCSGDWFQSRSEQGQLVQAVVPTRGRIETTGDGGGATMMSTFDFPIARLWYIDTDGAIWEASDVAPGKNFTCTASSNPAALEVEANRMSAMFKDQAKDLFQRRGYFVAITDEAPGIETFRNIRWRETHTVITGPIAKP